jgi:hypothetical protein
MSEATNFYVEGFLLRIFDSAYLVQVKPANGETGFYQHPSSLPGWAFRSSHAIWLSDEDAPMVDRARTGESIKHQLMSRL